MGLKLDAQPESSATAMGATDAKEKRTCFFMAVSEFGFCEFGRLKKNPGHTCARDHLDHREELSCKIEIKLAQLRCCSVQALTYGGLCND